MTDKTVDKMTDKKKRKIDETWPIFGVKLKKTETGLTVKKEEKLTRSQTSIQKRSVSDTINSFNLITSDEGIPGYVADGEQPVQAQRGEGARLAVKRGLVPGGQDSLAETREQHLGRRVS